MTLNHLLRYGRYRVVDARYTGNDLAVDVPGRRIAGMWCLSTWLKACSKAYPASTRPWCTTQVAMPLPIYAYIGCYMSFRMSV